MAIYKLIMIDECGDEVECETFNLSLLTDEDEIAVWQSIKEAKYAEMYPEARGFYWEDRSQWDRIINSMLNGRIDDEFDEDTWDEDLLEGARSNCFCDTHGYCPYGGPDDEICERKCW